MKDLNVKWGNYGEPLVIYGPVYRMTKLSVGAEGKHGIITEYTSDWARIGYEKVSDKSTMLDPRPSGHEIEGSVRIKGVKYSAFTSGGDNPDGGSGMIIIRQKATSRIYAKRTRAYGGR